MNKIKRESIVKKKYYVKLKLKHKTVWRFKSLNVIKVENIQQFSMYLILIQILLYFLNSVSFSF